MTLWLFSSLTNVTIYFEHLDGACHPTEASSIRVQLHVISSPHCRWLTYPHHVMSATKLPSTNTYRFLFLEPCRLTQLKTAKRFNSWKDTLQFLLQESVHSHNDSLKTHESEWKPRGSRCKMDEKQPVLKAATPGLLSGFSTVANCSALWRDFIMCCSALFEGAKSWV